jgi:peroxiredoxin-like protein
MDYHFTVNGEWKGTRNDVGSVGSKGFQTPVSVDTSMKGAGVGTNPDELLIAATQSCYMITLASILNARSIPYQVMNVRSEGVVSEEGGLHFESIAHYPTIVLDETATDELVEAATTAAYRAEEKCMIGNAVRGQVKLSAHPTIKKG